MLKFCFQANTSQTNVKEVGAFLVEPDLEPALDVLTAPIHGMKSHGHPISSSVKMSVLFYKETADRAKA